MRALKALAAAGLFAVGLAGISGSEALASPLATPAIHLDRATPVAEAQYYGPPPRRRYAPPAPRYRQRTVCRTVVRTVRTPRGNLVRRPVEVCRRRY
jgi:hypothetical protein